MIALPPHGQYMNEVFELIIEDIAIHVAQAISYVDPYGRTVVIFLNLVTSFRDYPAVLSCTDMKFHTETSLYTLSYPQEASCPFEFHGLRNSVLFRNFIPKTWVCKV